MIISVDVNGRCAKTRRSAPITSGSIGVECLFLFDDSWDGLEKTAVFIAGREQRDVLLVGNSCVVPWEVLQYAGADLYIGVYGAAGSEIAVPTVYALAGNILPGADPSGDPSVDPTLPVYEQLREQIGDLDDLTTEDKSSLVAAINEAAQTGGGGGGTWNNILYKPFSTLGDTLKVNDGVLDVNAINAVEQDNTLPITSAAVYTEVGNINAVLALI